MPRRLSVIAPPDPPLVDDAVRLDPLGPRYVPDFERLLTDQAVLGGTRVPSNPPPGFAAR